jgi:hypothetical protein
VPAGPEAVGEPVHARRLAAGALGQEQPRAWLIVGVLFISWFLVWGGGPNTTALFFPPVLEFFGFSRAKLSSGFAIGALSAGLIGPII